MKLHTRVRTARKKLGLTLRDIENLSGNKITNVYVSFLERGEPHYRNPKPETLRILAPILRIPFIELMLLAKHITPADLTDLKGLQ